jgi:hypothetical protein
MSPLEKAVVCAVGSLLAASAAADNSIHQWLGEPNDVDVFGGNWVRIKAPGSFGFEALDRDPNDPNTILGLGYFLEIEIDPNCPAGTVNVYILHDPNDPNSPGGPGAIDVYWVHLLDATNVTGSLAELRITGDLGSELGTNEASNAGLLVVGGALLSDLWIDDAITDDVTIDTLAADIRAYSMQDLTVTQGTGTPSITIGGTYSANMDIGASLDELYFGNTMSGAVELSAPLHALTASGAGIAGTFTTAPDVDVDQAYLHYVTGTLSIGGSLGSTTVTQSVTGTISVAGTLEDCLISGNVSGTVAADYIGEVGQSGLDVEGAVNGSDAEHPAVIDVAQDVLTFVSAGSVGPYGRIELGGFANQLTVGTLEGLVHVGTDLIHSSVGVFAESGVLDVAHDMLSALYTANTLAGHINVFNDMQGAIIANDFTEGNADLTGTVTIGGSMKGNALIYFDGRLRGRGYVGEPNEPPLPADAGSIRIDGALNTTSAIQFDMGKIGSQACIAVNYDGYGLESWDPNTPIILGDPNDPNSYYYGNTPAERLWAVSACRGDLDNSGTVDFDDLNPFVAALRYPAQYAVDFPGLDGSRVWKGDANCDGSFTNADTNPFIALVSSECCDSECPGCEGGDAPGGGLPDPDELAADLAANIWPELYDGMLAVIVGAIDAAPDEETQAYWQAVYAALTE